MSAPAFPIRPVGLRVRDFRGWRGEHEFALERGLTLVVGENAAGKSSLLNAVEWCLFGTEVGKRGSGIAERGDWEVAHREADGAVEVELELAVEAGTAKLSRRRDAKPKRGEPDVLELELPDGEVLAGDEVVDWLSWSRMPDWTTWKRAFCQHQELLRARLIENADRSAQLGGLLGLAEYADWSARLRAVKAGGLRKLAKEELGRIEDEFRRLHDAPRRTVAECEAALTERGVPREEWSTEGRYAREQTLLDAARALSSRFELRAELPSTPHSDPEGTREWIPRFERALGEAVGRRDEELGRLRAGLTQLDATLQGLAPADRKLRDAEAAWAEARREHGGLERLNDELDALRVRREEWMAREKERGAARALLREALEVIELTHRAEACPVCEQPAEDLRARLAERVGRGEDETERAKLAEIVAREKRVEAQREELVGRKRERDRARTFVDEARATLARWTGEEAGDPVRAAREWARENRARLEETEADLADARKLLADLVDGRAVLELHDRRLAAAGRTDAAAGDLEGLSGWRELQGCIDEAAGLEVDLAFLGALTRDLQERRSRERVEVVNRGLAEHAGTISRGSDVRVNVKATAANLSYALVDASGRNVLPTLNQAGLHALSFALLFAQARARSRDRLPAFVLLDDPAQSLDEAHVRGLAHVIADVARDLPVVVATFPGPLEEELRGRGARVLELASARPRPAAREQGVRP